MHAPVKTWAAFLGLILAATPAVAEGLGDHPELLTCDVIVTGTDMRERPEALARCVREVVVKVTGKPALADDPRVGALATRAAELIEDLVYLDRMTDIPTHDEQGTRDRPFDLIAHVDPAKLGPELAAMGIDPWLSRPTLLALVTVARGGQHFPLAADALEGERMRQAILAAGRRYGLRVALPDLARISSTGLDQLTPEDLRVGGPLKRAAVLRGDLQWSEAEFGWAADWRIRWGDRDVRWQIRGVSFDEAFRSGIGGAAALLSGPG